MAKILFRQDAIDDLNDIWNYTLINWSEKQADKYYGQIKLDCVKIGDNPEIGKRYFEVKLNLLGLNCGNHIIFYMVTSVNKIEIIRILHEKMDLKNKFRNYK